MRLPQKIVLIFKPRSERNGGKSLHWPSQTSSKLSLDQINILAPKMLQYKLINSVFLVAINLVISRKTFKNNA
jgi:hypothetical protein